MPQVISKTAYTFEELSDNAKERAIEKHRDRRASWWTPDDLETVIDDAERMGAILGITIEQQAYNNMAGGKVYITPISYDLGGRYGQSVGFSGSYSYVKGAAKAIRAEAPQDTELHAIADKLQAIQRKNFYSLYARIDSNRDPGITCEVSDNRDEYRDVPDADDLQETLQDFAHWVYRQLESENEYQNSDEYLKEEIEANEYTFDADGNPSD